MRDDRRTGPVSSPATTSAIEAAVVQELSVRGFGGLTIEGVARRARVGKAAVYRRWPSKREMVVDVLVGIGREAATQYPDTGTLEGDLTALLSIGVRQLSHPLVAAIVPDLLAEAGRDREFGMAMHERMGRRRRELGLEMLQRAVDRGELPADLDRSLAADIVAAPLYWRMLVTREPFDEAVDGPALVAATIAGLRAARLSDAS